MNLSKSEKTQVWQNKKFKLGERKGFLTCFLILKKKNKHIRRLCCHTVSFGNFQSEEILGRF